MKWTVYYAVRVGGKVNRAYPEYMNSTDVKNQWIIDNGGSGKIYLQHEPHDDYTDAYAKAGMVGADPDDLRDWLKERVEYLDSLLSAQARARAANMVPANPDVYGGHKPGDIVRDQNGRSGRVPQVELEVFRRKAISGDTAMDAVRDFCKGER